MSKFFETIYKQYNFIMKGILRYANKIKVLFAGGEIDGTFTDKGTYNIYNIPGSPGKKVINCNLTIKTGLRDYILSGIFGQMEVSGKIK